MQVANKAYVDRMITVIKPFNCNIKNINSKRHRIKVHVRDIGVNDVSQIYVTYNIIAKGGDSGNTALTIITGITQKQIVGGNLDISFFIYTTQTNPITELFIEGLAYVSPNIINTSYSIIAPTTLSDMDELMGGLSEETIRNIRNP